MMGDWLTAGIVGWLLGIKLSEIVSIVNPINLLRNSFGKIERFTIAYDLDCPRLFGAKQGRHHA